MKTTWAEERAAMFERGTTPLPGPTPVDPAALKVFVVRHGEAMAEITLDEATAHAGEVRLLTAKHDPQGLTEQHLAQVGALLRRSGSRHRIQREQISIDWAPRTPATEHAAAIPGSRLGRGATLTWPIREARFLAKAFAASLVPPLPTEVIGGLATKSFALVSSIGVYWATVGVAHPFALAGLIALSVTQEVFHGLFLKTWNNFQESLHRARGFNYQMFFNLAYMQGFGVLYRALSWTANPGGVTPPWSVRYWRDMAVMSVVGTFFGVLGYNGLNALYAKGAIRRWQHSAIQHARDLCFLLAAPFFASGSMAAFWVIFACQQLLDLAIAVWAGRMPAHALVFVTTGAVSRSAEFRDKYPAAGGTIEPPLRQAAKAVLDNPLVRLVKLVLGGGRP